MCILCVYYGFLCFAHTHPPPTPHQQQHTHTGGCAIEVHAALRLDKLTPNPTTTTTTTLTALLGEDIYGPFVGQVTAATRSAIRGAVREAGARLVEAMYLAEIAVNGADALSGVYAVLGRRRARVLRDEMREGSDTFVIHAYLPAEASFGLADELRKRCSGAASASLLLSHWERMQVGVCVCVCGGGGVVYWYT